MSGSYRSPAEVSFPNFLARQVLSQVPVAIAGISKESSRDYKPSFLSKEEFLKNQDDTPVQVKQTQTIANGLRLASLLISSGVGERMTLRIERVKGRIRLSGEFRIAHLDQVKTETERCESPVALDLEELDLIDLEGVRFLNACEAKGISVLHCSPYIREWMSQERIREKKR